MISINKPHTDSIRVGLKKLEVRKNFPKDGFLFLSGFCPFVAYMYETKRKGGCGKVIGEFVCDHIEEFWCNDGYYLPTGSIKKRTCLTNSEMLSYGKGKPLYGWHISKLKIYDKPKEISQFVMPCKNGTCYGCKQFHKYRGGECKNTLTRPPQSWCYVEEKDQ